MRLSPPDAASAFELPEFVRLAILEAVDVEEMLALHRATVINPTLDEPASRAS